MKKTKSPCICSLLVVSVVRKSHDADLCLSVSVMHEALLHISFTLSPSVPHTLVYCNVVSTVLHYYAANICFFVRSSKGRVKMSGSKHVCLCEKQYNRGSSEWQRPAVVCYMNNTAVIGHRPWFPLFLGERHQ